MEQVFRAAAFLCAVAHFVCQGGTMTCPNSSASGCFCPDHALGLLAFTVNDEHHKALTAALDKLREPQAICLTVLTFDPEPASNVVEFKPPVMCDNTYDCPCSDCEATRARRVMLGGRRDDHPFDGMPVKIRRAA